MSATRPPVLVRIISNFMNSLKSKQGKPKLVGEDFHGTKYYEALALASSRRKRAARSFEPKLKDKFDQEIPAEWESWLRYRRMDPPTVEEVEANHKLALIKKENAAKLEAAYLEEKGLQKLDESKPSEKVQSFPVFKEYRNHGQNYEPKPNSK